MRDRRVSSESHSSHRGGIYLGARSSLVLLALRWGGGGLFSLRRLLGLCGLFGLCGFFNLCGLSSRRSSVGSRFRLGGLSGSSSGSGSGVLLVSGFGGCRSGGFLSGFGGGRGCCFGGLRSLGGVGSSSSSSSGGGVYTE